MKRRQLIKYSGLLTAGLAFTACQQPTPDKNSPYLNPDQSNQAVNFFGDLEKTDLKLGFIPIIEAAPLIIAYEKGIFRKYGLNVQLQRYSTWEEIDQGLKKYQLDGAQALLAMPLQAQMSQDYAPMISLMMLNRNGGAIVLNQAAWEAKLRPSLDYDNFREFSTNARSYLRNLNKNISFGLDSAFSMNSYILRYWLAAMGITPEKEVKLQSFASTEMLDKLQAGIIQGYSLNDPWTQAANQKKAAFTAYISRDIWHNHPGNIIAVMQPWIKKNPSTAKALIASLLEACIFCDRQENRPLVAQILTQRSYLNIEPILSDQSLVNPYNYGGFDQENRQISIPDYIIFHNQTNSLKKPDHANYPWLSDGIWILTQMIRWNQISQREYPKDADQILAKTYPVKIYEEVAKALGINLPSYRLKTDVAGAFIDQRPFDPGQPVAYLNQFEIRA